MMERDHAPSGVIGKQRFEVIDPDARTAAGFDLDIECRERMTVGH